MRRAAVVAARVLADLWPDGQAVADVEDVSALHFVVRAEHDGVVVRRTGEVMGGALWDVIDMGRRSRSSSSTAPAGCRTEPCRSSCPHGASTVGIGTKETFCRVCGFDEGDDRYFVGEPQYVICPCCESKSGLDDWGPEDVRRARRAWIEGGRTWRYPEHRPADWDPDAALATLPAKWRGL